MVGLPTVMTTATFDCFSHREAQPRACVTAACSAAVFGDRKRGKPGNKSYAGERSDPRCGIRIHVYSLETQIHVLNTCIHITPNLNTRSRYI